MNVHMDVHGRAHAREPRPCARLAQLCADPFDAHLYVEAEDWDVTGRDLKFTGITG